MDTLTALENIPTQEKKFRNFASNSLKLKRGDEKIVSAIWDVLAKEKQKEIDAVKQEQEQQQQQQTKEQPPANAPKEEMSAKISDSEKEDADADFPTNDKEVKKVVKKALKKASNKSLKFKSLRKEVKNNLILRASCDAVKGKLRDMDDKKWKVVIMRIVEENPDKLKLDGKLVQLVD